MDDHQETVRVLFKLFEENERLKDAGAKRNDPATWRPDLTRPIGEHLDEVRSAN